ncbi:hypothetical protein [Tenacibaculum phage Larrie]|nr:hypothetical protein [Tenacibaculum phage Larrie]
MDIKKQKELTLEAIESSDIGRFKKKILKNRTILQLGKIEKESEVISLIKASLYGSPIIYDFRKFDEKTYIVLTNEDKYWRTVNISKCKSINQVSETYEEQLLITLGHKYEAGRDFLIYAGRMLGEKFAESH